MSEPAKVPVFGAPCAWCGEMIDRESPGVATESGECLHTPCLLRMTVGSVGHLTRRCSCYGGTEEDPPWLTRRQAALAAAAEWRRQNRCRLPLSGILAAIRRKFAAASRARAAEPEPGSGAMNGPGEGSGIRYYDRSGDPITFALWIELLEDTEYCQVAFDRLDDGGRVSTLWHGLDSRRVPAPRSRPLIFETVWFGPDDSIQEQLRYQTEQEALRGHGKVLRAARLMVGVG